MFPLRTLLIASLPLLVLSSMPEQCASQPPTHHSSAVLASLQCYNDFTTQIRCTWEEKPHRHTHMLISNGKLCVPDGHGKLQSSGKLTQSCVYKPEVFSMGGHDFFFNTSCPSKVTTLNIAAQGKVLPPTNFTEKNENGGNRLLSWSSPYPPSSLLSLNLTYQLKYRRHKHEWIVVDDINDTELVIKSQALFPSYSYEARVRARGPVGLWSDWSPRLVWVAAEEGVINLQCVIKEGGLICSWQVKKWQANFLSYHLCGHANGTRMKCNHCTSHTKHPDLENILDFTCLLDSPKPELLTVDIRSLRKTKLFSNSDNIQTPPPSRIQAEKKDGIWRLSWTRPDVTKKLTLFYQVYLESNDTKDKVELNFSDAHLSTNIPSSLQPSTGYMARVRAFPSQDFAGRPSDWSYPIYFTTDPAPWINIVLYVLAAFVSVSFIILYNTLPACRRKIVLWNISIPSPINSKVLGEMSNKKFLAGEANLYTCDEKTSVFVIQASDNPVICKGSISEYPLLKHSDDIDMDLGMSKSAWPKGSNHSSLFTEGSRMKDQSGISFTGPYILCREDSSVPSETSETFSSLLTLDDDGRYISESPKVSLPIIGGYVLSPPKNPTSACSNPIANLANQNRELRNSELPIGDPPAYTPSPGGVSNAVFSHPSGYCLMPNMDIVAAWVTDSVPSPEGNIERNLHKIDSESPERSYVTLSQQGF